VVYLLLHCEFLFVRGVPVPSGPKRKADKTPSPPRPDVQPIIPYTIKGHTDVECHICNFRQPLEHRPDVQALKHGGNGVPLQHHGQQDHGGGGPRPPGNQGWGEHQSPPPGNQPMRYG